MGYDVHVTRRARFWDAEGEAISADEWTAPVAADPELEMAGAAEAATGAGTRHPAPGTRHPASASGIRYENNLRARMVTHPDPDGAWLDLREAVITVKNPDDVLLTKTKVVAALFGAKVQGDDREDHPF
ncbi:hypothetical protein AB0C77_23590 [Streptomyces sp. NPDC048629]|uniref:hypothetical protein n=1 Tax=Streptomyces sp. NPDC048629 TaxID=3154824 RepID=UPI003441CADB